MFLRQRLLSAGLALACLGAVLAPTTPAAIAADSADVVVEVSDGGVFEPYFCDISYAAVQSQTMNPSESPTATEDGLAVEAFNICYTDTVSYRPGFDAQLSATDFLMSGNPSVFIANENLRIIAFYGVLQTQSGAGIGDIGLYNNGNDTLPQPPFIILTTNNDLGQTRTVQFGWNGKGTIQAMAGVNTELDIPAGTANGTYTSELTLSIIPNGRTK